MTGFLEIVAVAGTLLAIAAWLVVVLLSPGRSSQSRSPGRGAAVARLWLYAPFWVPALLLFASLTPGVTSALMGRGDHCMALGTSHHHLCLLHPPHVADHLVSWAFPLVVVVPIVVSLMLFVRRAVLHYRLSRTMIATSNSSELGPDVRVVENSEPVAMTVGWLRPAIVLSRGLLDGLSPSALHVVLAHERAHVARRDTLAALVDRLAASILPSPVAAALLAEIELAREQECDLIAANGPGALAVAAALTEVARLGLPVPATGVSIASGSLRRRVVHLLDPPVTSSRWLAVSIVVLSLLVAAGAGPLHTGIEELVSLLIH